MRLKYNSITTITLFIFGLSAFLILQAAAYEKMEGHHILTEAYMRKLERNSTFREIGTFVLVCCWVASNLLSISNFKEYKSLMVKILIIAQTVLTALSFFYLLILTTAGGFM